MSQRLNRVRILAATLELAQPSITHNVHSTAGFNPRHKQPCNVCQETGRLTKRKNAQPCRAHGNHAGHGCHPCAVCGGHGYALVDLMDDKPHLAQPDRELPSAQTVQRRVDRLLALSRGDYGQAYADEPPEFQALCVSVAAGHMTFTAELRTQGSYGDLEHAITLLDDQYPRLSRSFNRAWIQQDYKHLHPDAQSMADTALQLVAKRMPERIRVPWFLRSTAQVQPAVKTNLWRGHHPETKAQRRDRDDQIRQAIQAGSDPGTVAKRWRIEKRHVRRILAA